MFIEEQAKVEKRRFPRAQFHEAVHYQLKDESKFGGCLASDIGEGGIQVSLNDFVPINTELVLQMKLGRLARVVDLTGRVAWLQRVPFSDRYQVGLEFTKPDPFS